MDSGTQPSTGARAATAARTATLGARIARLGFAVVFLWFGALKFVPGLSPAEALIEKTVGWCVDPTWFIPTLAAWECAIGVGLIADRFPRTTLLLLFAHMGGTFLPVVVCPDQVWTQFPHAFTLEGQYILKNFVLVGGAMVLACRALPGYDTLTDAEAARGVHATHDLELHRPIVAGDRLATSATASSSGISRACRAS